jgi:cytochrome P450
MSVEASPAADVDVLAHFATPEFRRDPAPFLRWLREEAPVHRTAQGFYLVSRFADVAWMSGAGRDVVLRPSRERMDEQLPGARRHRALATLLDSLVMSNPPDHARLRRYIGAAFTPQRVDRLRQRIAEVCERRLDQIEAPLRDGESVDLHHEWSLPVSLQVIAELLGVPEEDVSWLGPGVRQISDGISSATDELLDIADQRTEELEEYFDRLVVERRRKPGDDLISALAVETDGAADITGRELFELLWLLWLAGFESSASMLDQSVIALFEHPDQARWLRAGYQEAVAFADEVLRYNVVELFTPIARITARDIELSGVTVPAGSDLRPVIAAANRDPEQFPDPDRFDAGRDNAVSGFSFGQGIHRCVGAFLARAEMAVGTSLLGKRFPNLAPAGEPTFKDEIVTTRMTVSFPVTLEA